jgi:hypothetical protein
MLEKKRTKQSAKHSVRGDGIMDKSSHEDGHDEGAQESKYETLHTHVNECGNVTSMRPAGLSALCWRFRVSSKDGNLTLLIDVISLSCS